MLLLFVLCFGKTCSDLAEVCVGSTVWPRRGDISRKALAQVKGG